MRNNYHSVLCRNQNLKTADVTMFPPLKEGE